MSGVSLPVTRPAGRALVVGSPTGRAQPLDVLQRLGFTCAELDDPYHAMAELCRRPLVYRAVILSLGSFFREELAFIGAVRRKFPHVDVWVTHIEGRQAFLAEAMRLGADGLLADDGLHRTAIGTPLTAVQSPGEGFGVMVTSPISMPRPAAPPTTDEGGPVEPRGRERGGDAGADDDDDDEERLGLDDDEAAATEPVLTADELRALLQEQPMLPPSGDE